MGSALHTQSCCPRCQTRRIFCGSHRLQPAVTELADGFPHAAVLRCAAEFALLRLFAKEQAERGGPSFGEGKPLVHAVYVAPLEALVAEKYAEWSGTLGKALGIKIAKLTGECRVSGEAQSG